MEKLVIHKNLNFLHFNEYRERFFWRRNSESLYSGKLVILCH